MVNYKFGKIYLIRCLTTDKVYIGSTCMKYLSQRLNKHSSDYRRYLKGKYNYVTSFEIIKGGNYQIELIESFSCNDVNELRTKEKHYIQLNKNEIVNKCIPLRTDKEYRTDNKNKIKERHSELVTCECGTSIQKYNLKKHKQSLKHQMHFKAIDSLFSD